MIPYQAFADHLKDNKIIASPAELHGHLSGMLVVNIDLKLEDWLKDFLQDYSLDDSIDPSKVKLVLESFFEFVASELKSESYKYDILMPSDNTSLAERLEALASWCHSFMLGLAFAGLKTENHLPKEVQEFLLDLDKISKVDSAVDETQGEEADFVELTEYLKAGVFTLYEEFQEYNQAINPTVQ